MNRLPALLTWETRRLLRNRTAWLAAAGLLLAGLLAVFSGLATSSAQRTAADRLPGLHQAQMERIASQFAEGGEAGNIAYYTFFPTHHPAPPLAPLTLGVREVAPNIHWIRLLGLEGQIYESEIGNPALQALGGLDLAFVLIALAPLALLVLTHDSLTRDRTAGRLPLLASQSGSLTTLLAVRILLPAVGIFLVLSALAALAAFLNNASFTQLLPWLTASAAYLAFWAAVSGLLAAACRTPAASLSVALASWITLVILAPALLNLSIATAYAAPEGLQLTVAQRQETHSGWDRPKESTLSRFYATHPEWKDAPPVTSRFAWRWYYAMHQIGDESVAPESRRYHEQLRARHTTLRRVSWLIPPAYTQILLASRAGTDLDAHLNYLDRVRAFHTQLRQYFYPLLFGTKEATLQPADYAGFPRFDTTPPPPPPATSAAPPLLLATFLALLAWIAAKRLPLFA